MQRPVQYRITSFGEELTPAIRFATTSDGLVVVAKKVASPFKIGRGIRMALYAHGVWRTALEFGKRGAPAVQL